ncbi:hypothetical protein ABT330_21545, partial [Streptomyces sp. NPDC000658]
VVGEDGCFTGEVGYYAYGPTKAEAVRELAESDAVAGGLAVGLAVGTATGVALALAPRRLLARPVPRGLLAACTAGLPLAALSVALLAGDGYTLASYPPSTNFVDGAVILTIALVAAARSGEIAGCDAEG